MEKLTDMTAGVKFSPCARPCLGYVPLANGGVRLAGKENPSPYTDAANPALMPSDVLRARHRADDIELAENAALMASVSRANGEGHARDNAPWKIGRHEVVMGEITSDSDLLDWLLQTGLTEKVTGESTDTGLHSVCYRLCMDDVRFLRVHQRERHHSVAMEAAANAAGLLWACALDQDSTIRVRGKFKGLSLLAATLQQSGGKFPIMRLVGWLCSLETMSELNRTRLEYSAEKAAELTRRIDNTQMDAEKDHDVDSWIAYLIQAASDEKGRKGADTLRQDMLALYRFLRNSRRSEGSKFSKTGVVGRDAIQAEFGWSKSYYGRVMLELKISHCNWFSDEETARKNIAGLREQYRRSFIGDKKQQAANKA